MTTVTPFPQDQVLMVAFSSGTDTPIWRGQVSNSGVLDSIDIWMLNDGTPGGSETLQLVVVSGADSSQTALASSDVINLSDFTVSNSHTYGVVHFEFSGTDRVYLDSASTYSIRLETTNYTKGSFEIGVVSAQMDPAPSQTVNSLARLTFTLER